MIYGTFRVLVLLSSGGVRMSPLGTSAIIWAIVPSPGDDKCGAVGGMRNGRGDRSTRKKPAPVPLVRHKTHITRPGMEPGLPRWKAGN
jgi:hypothetical protein